MNKYKKWLQERVAGYGIDLTDWDVELVESKRPSHYPGHLPYSGQMIIATHPDNNLLEITVEDVCTDKNGNVIQSHSPVLG